MDSMMTRLLSFKLKRGISVSDVLAVAALILLTVDTSILSHPEVDMDS
jgi:hypothetical protein